MAPVASPAADMISRTAKLLPRASNNGSNAQNAARTGFAVWAIVLIVIIVTVAVFCGVVLCLILKNRRKRKQRQQKFEAERSKNSEAHEYRAVGNRDSSEMNSNSRVLELPPDNLVRDPTPHRVTELPVDANAVPKVGEADSHALPPSYNPPAPVELPANAHTKTAS